MNLLNTKFVTVIIFLIYNIGSFSLKHPLHVSTTEVNFNALDKNLEVSCKVFTDDFESILAKTNKQKVDLTKPEMKTAMDILVKKYLVSHLKINVDGKQKVLNYIGFEIDHEATNIYLEVEKLQSVKKVDVETSILYDLFDDQMSIIHITKGQNRKSGKILYPEKTFSANF